VVTECAAICAYLADVFPEGGLGPREEEKADYYRWFFYAAGPWEQAGTNHAMGWDPPEDKQRMFGYGNYEKAIAAVDELLSLRDYVCGDRFTAADVYLGSQIMFPMQFGMLAETDSFLRYRDRLTARDAYKRANEIDEAATQQMQAAQPQPA
jgi:glutathione S-transferase